MLGNDFVVLSAFGVRCSAGVSLLIGFSLNADVNLVFARDGDRLVVANVAVKSFAFRVVAIYTSTSVGERWLESFLDDLKRIVQVGDWNAILDTKIDRVGRG